MIDESADPYTVRHGESHTAPANLRARLKCLGLWAIFIFQALMAGFVVWFVVLGMGPK